MRFDSFAVELPNRDDIYAVKHDGYVQMIVRDGFMQLVDVDIPDDVARRLGEFLIRDHT